MTDNGSIDGKLRVELLEARQICLVDENGRSRAEMRCRAGSDTTSGYVVVHLYDSDGRPRVSLQVDDREGASVTLFNKGNSPCVSLGVLNDRGNGVTICDSEGKPRISVGADRAAEITVLSSDGEEVWGIDG